MFDINALLPQLEKLCRKYDVKRLELVGSAVGENFREGSDVDFLVEFNDLLKPGISNRYFGLVKSLEKILYRKVDLIETGAVRNPYFKASINKNRKLIYGA